MFELQSAELASESTSSECCSSAHMATRMLAAAIRIPIVATRILMAACTHIPMRGSLEPTVALHTPATMGVAMATELWSKSHHPTATDRLTQQMKR